MAMNFVLFIVSLIGFYIFFPLVIGLLALPIPNSLLLKAPRLQTIITALFYGFLVGVLTEYFMSKPSVSWPWIYMILGGFMAQGLPYMLENIGGFSFEERDVTIIASIWGTSLAAFILALVIF